MKDRIIIAVTWIGIVIFCVMFWCLALTAAFGQTVIDRDLGGSIEARLQSMTKLQNTRVEIRGICASACTLYLGLPNVCVDPRARLGFHGPSSQFYGVSLPPDQFDHWSRIMADHYPAPIAAWFMAEARMKTMEITTITGAQAIRMGAKECQK